MPDRHVPVRVSRADAEWAADRFDELYAAWMAGDPDLAMPLFLRVAGDILAESHQSPERQLALLQYAVLVAQSFDITGNPENPVHTTDQNLRRAGIARARLRWIESMDS